MTERTATQGLRAAQIDLNGVARTKQCPTADAARAIYGKANFDPDQPRVEGGRWTDGGGTNDDPNGEAESTSEGDDDWLQQVRQLAPPRAPPRLPGVIGTAIATAIAFFTWLTSRNTGELAPVIVFNAREFAPSERPDIAPASVGLLTREQDDATCPRHSEVQDRTTRLAAEVAAEGMHPSPQRFGAEVHIRLAREINGPGGSAAPHNPNFRAEYSLIKSRDAAYAEPGSRRIDVLWAGQFRHDVRL